MNLTIDIGNTNIKMGIFERNEMKSMDIFNNSNQIEFTKYFENIPENTIKTAIICSVIDTDKEFIDALKSKFPVIIFDSSTPIPIKNLYQSPNSLGPDRLASVIDRKSTRLNSSHAT